MRKVQCTCKSPGDGGGGWAWGGGSTLFYTLYRYVPPDRVGFLRGSGYPFWYFWYCNA